MVTFTVHVYGEEKKDSSFCLTPFVFIVESLAGFESHDDDR